MASVWKQLLCQTCGSNEVELVDGILCCKVCKSKHTLEEKITEEEVISLNVAATDRNAYKFEDALERYEQLLQKYPDSEAANWGALLADYGIAYVKDYDGKLIPTCHRLNERPIDVCSYYYKLNDDHKSRANEIEKLRVSIMKKAEKIQPYDVFICYKATEEVFGRSVPTKEAGWAREIYTMLKHKLNLRVFFAEESLAGDNADWEPHIYKALNTAKLMFVLATGKENVNAVWVKNEWKRFYRYAKEKQDKTIRVVYDIMNAYDLPWELQDVQAINHNTMTWGEAVKKAAEEIFKQEEEIPEWKKALDEMREKMESMPTNTPTVPHNQTEKNVSGFEIEDDILIEYKGNKEHVIIPDGITKIYEEAFFECDTLTSIVIPDSVTSIGEGAFNRCKNLTSVTIGNGVTSIGNSAFFRCRGLRNVTIPNRVKSIGMCAFAQCDSLTSIVIPESVTTIRSSAFSGCKSLTSIVILDGVTSIDAWAFFDCKNLTSIVIPESVTSMGTNVFKGCNKDLKIYARAEKKPQGWYEKRGGFFNLMVVESWNPDKRPVVWGYKGETK